MKEHCIQNLVVQYEKELVRLGYKKGTIKNYRTFWNALVRYFHANNEKYFRKDIAFRFLYERYEITNAQQTKELTRNEQAVRDSSKTGPFSPIQGSGKTFSYYN